MRGEEKKICKRPISAEIDELAGPNNKRFRSHEIFWKRKVQLTFPTSDATSNIVSSPFKTFAELNVLQIVFVREFNYSVNFIFIVS